MKQLRHICALSMGLTVIACTGGSFSSGSRDKDKQSAADSLSSAEASGENKLDPAKEEEKEKSYLVEEEIFNKMPTGANQLKVICSRTGQDRVRTVFCGTNPPAVTSLIGLQNALRVGLSDGAQFAITGHSSSLVARFTSSINPRVVLFNPPNNNTVQPDFVTMGFERGEQFAEVISRDAQSGTLAFFLFVFEQACNKNEKGCSHGDLLTPAVESNWTGVTIYEDLDLENTVADCKMCHQPGGPSTGKMLRMQELRNPWTHWFRNNRPGGQALIADYQAAHGTTETYGGIAGNQISNSDPADLETFVRAAGFANQPNEFLTGTIEGEVRAVAPNQPADNSVAGTSATWSGLYEQAVAGRVIQTPFREVKVSDPAKLATMTKAYQDFLAGTLSVAALPDIREVFPAARMRDIGFMVKDGLDGRGILTHACRQCHNDALNPNISRFRFSIDKLDTMSREEKDIAIQRLKMPEDALLLMPPRRFKTLTPEEIQKAVDFLKQ